MAMALCTLQSSSGAAASPYAALDRAVLPLIVSALLHTWKDDLPAAIEEYFSQINEPVAFLDLTGLVLQPRTLEKVTKWFPNCIIYKNSDRPISDSYYEPIVLEMIRYTIVNNSVDFSKQVRLAEPGVDRIYARFLNELRKLVQCRRLAAIPPAVRLRCIQAPRFIHPFLRAIPYLLPKVETDYSYNQETKAPYKTLISLFSVSRQFAHIRHIIATSLSQLRSPYEISTAAAAPVALARSQGMVQAPKDESLVRTLLQPVSMRQVTVLDLRRAVPPAGAKWAERIATAFPHVHTLHWPFKLPLSTPVAKALARMPIRTLDISLADKKDVTGLAFFVGLTELSNNTPFTRYAWQSVAAYQTAYQEMVQHSPPLAEIQEYQPHRETTADLVHAASRLRNLERLDLGSSDTLEDQAFDAIGQLRLQELTLEFPKITIKTLRKINPVRLSSLCVLQCTSFKEAELQYMTQNFRRVRRLYLDSTIALAKTAALLTRLPELEALMLDQKPAFTLAECSTLSTLRKLQKLVLICAKQFPAKGLSAFAAWEQLKFLRIEGNGITESEAQIFRQLRARLTFIHIPRAPLDAEATAAGPLISKADAPAPAAGRALDQKRDFDEKEKSQVKSKDKVAAEMAALIERLQKTSFVQAKAEVQPHNLRKMKVDAGFLGLLEAHITKHPTLTEIMLPNCELNTKVLTLLGKLKQLVKLDATICRGYDLREIATHCPQLTSFQNELNDPYEALWMDPEQATHLRENYHNSLPKDPENLIHGAKLSRSDFEALTKLKQLKVLHLDAVAELPGDTFLLLGDMLQLQELHLDTHTFSAKEAVIFSKLVNLHTLNITGAPVGDVGIGLIAQYLKKLRLLYLAQNGLTDKGMQHLAGISDLETLSLGFQRQVSTAGFAELLRLQKLKRLLLVNSGNLTDKTIIQIIEQCAALQVLHLLSADLPSASIMQAAAKRKVMILHSEIEREDQAALAAAP